MTIALLYQNWSPFRRLKTANTTPANDSVRDRDSNVTSVSVTMIVRISIFSVLPILALGLVVKSTFNDATATWTNKVGSNIATATLSSAAGLIFGTQQASQIL
ncbi:hypothetical protein VKT23_015846 [Stygiomarasmius scandens]|uniref:Uncharacterized protein n=1 Tax=Marasmiellus scandens TaxID=2682957 RepID=A0ABR1IWP5_9AGAR